MVHAQSKGFIFSGVISLSLLVASMQVQALGLSSRQDCTPLVLYGVGAAVASTAQSLIYGHCPSSPVGIDRKQHVVMDANCKQETESSLGLRVGAFTLGVRCPENATLRDKVLNAHTYANGFSFKNLALAALAVVALQKSGAAKKLGL
ncbi:hypothetical protein A3J41_03340 [candidate division TM6 bacterium RIFCSPHIGHO2_12_FULL_38_8]|nr:MAG: hypothetical protein A3J41_03340 [candidate division TM6 bacterium RIFCSPHIGHO2_12_FULL_38_8]